MGSASRVVVALSRGVDSAVAAYLVAERRCELTAITLRLHGEQDGVPIPSVAEPLYVLRVKSDENAPIVGTAAEFGSDRFWSRRCTASVARNRDVPSALKHRFAIEHNPFRSTQSLYQEEAPAFGSTQRSERLHQVNSRRCTMLTSC